MQLRRRRRRQSKWPDVVFRLEPEYPIEMAGSWERTFRFLYIYLKIVLLFYVRCQGLLGGRVAGCGIRTRSGHITSAIRGLYGDAYDRLIAGAHRRQW